MSVHKYTTDCTRITIFQEFQSALYSAGQPSCRSESWPSRPHAKTICKLRATAAGTTGSTHYSSGRSQVLALIINEGVEWNTLLLPYSLYSLHTAYTYSAYVQSDTICMQPTVCKQSTGYMKPIGYIQPKAVQQSQKHETHLANSPRPLTVATAALCLLRCPMDGLNSGASPSSTVALGVPPRQRSVPERLLFPLVCSASGLHINSRQMDGASTRAVVCRYFPRQNQ